MNDDKVPLANDGASPVNDDAKKEPKKSKSYYRPERWILNEDLSEDLWQLTLAPY